MSNGKRAVTLAVIKQADENMEDMKLAINSTMDYFKKVYPDIDFSISRNQTELLDYTISNLQQNLSLGFLFICIVAVLFSGGCQISVHHRTEYGGVHCNLFPVLLFVQDVTQHHFSVRIDSGVGYDD